MKPEDFEDDEPLECVEVPEGSKVPTGISELCAGDKHEECPGHGEYEGQLIFCVCDCHRVPASEVPS